MPAVWRHRIGWKLLALACAAMYVKPFALGVLLPVQVGLLLFLECILGFLWLASLFSYAFNVDRFPHRVWQFVAVPSGAITAYSLASFLGYRTTRLVVLDLNVAGWHSRSRKWRSELLLPWRRWCPSSAWRGFG
jgi:hypothetical protein